MRVRVRLTIRVRGGVRVGASPVVVAGLGFTPFAGVARCSSVCSVNSGLHALVVSAPGSGVFLLCGLIAAFLLASAGGSLTGGP